MKDQHAYWNSVANKKTFTHPLNPAWLPLSKESRILDYGCGYGRLMTVLQDLGYTQLEGVDFSEAMLQRAQRQHPQIPFSFIQHKKLPWPDATFSCVLLFAVLTCLPDAREQELLIAEIERILEPGGTLYLSDALLNQDARNLERYAAAEATYGQYGVFELPEGVVLRHHTIDYLKNLLQNFKLLKEQSLTLQTMNGNATNAWQALVQKT